MLRTLTLPIIAFAAATGVASADPASPDFVVIKMEQSVDASVDATWARVGGFCDIAEWLQIPDGCEIVTGEDGEVGAIRTVGNEVLVGKSQYSYTYTVPGAEDRPYIYYHGTIEAVPAGDDATTLHYTLTWDQSLIDGTAEEKATRVARYKAIFTRALGNMKTLAEGGELPAR